LAGCGLGGGAAPLVAGASPLAAGASPLAVWAFLRGLGAWRRLRMAAELRVMMAQVLQVM